MKRTPKRYQTREQILRDINAAHRKIKRLEKKAESELALEKTFKDSGTFGPGTKHRDLANKFLGQIKRLKETRLVRLGKTLAMFDTEPMPGVTDRSVVLQSISG